MRCLQSGLAPHRQRSASVLQHAKLPQAPCKGIPRLPHRLPSTRSKVQAQGTGAEPATPQQQQPQTQQLEQQPAALPQQAPVMMPVPGYEGQPAPAMMMPQALNPDGTPVSTATYMPQYPQGYPGMPVRSPQDMYMASPYAYPPPPPQAYRAEETSSGTPWWLFVGIGVVVGGLLGKVQEFMKNPKSPQQMMTEMAMKQMMGAMGGPGGKPGGFPGGMPGGMPPGFPPGFPPTPPPPSASGANATVDVPSYQTERKGEKFNSRRNTENGSSSPSTSNTASMDAATSSSEQDSARREAAATAEAIEPIVKEPTSSSKKSASSFFASVSEDSKKSQSTGNQQQQQQDRSTGSGATMSQMMETMMRDPEMQKMLYPYLPEPMRNPTSIEWMLSNPEVRKQMEDMFESQNMMSPQMMEMMKSMDFNQEKVTAQFQELGLKPEDVISKVMANPELAAGFSNPKVQAAILDISQNPMNIVKYNDQPEILKILEKVTEVFQPNMPPNTKQ